MLFNWIRKRTAQAVAEGFSDALDLLNETAEEQGDAYDVAADALRQRLKALPAPGAKEEDKKTGARSKTTSAK